MSRFHAASLLVSVAILGGCADATGPMPLHEGDRAPVHSAAAHPDSTGVTTASESDDPLLRNGGNMMGGGGR